MKKSVHFTEHFLIPLVLAFLNIGVVHLIYLFAHQGLVLGGHTILVALSLVLLAGSIIAKNKWLLLGGVVFYLAVFLLGIN